MRRYVTPDDAMRATYCRSVEGPPVCGHCDGEHGEAVRHDPLRGWCCKSCDAALDAMFGEPKNTE